METDRTTRAAINTRGCLEFLQGTKGHPGNALAFDSRHTLGQPLLAAILLVVRAGILVVHALDVYRS